MRKLFRLQKFSLNSYKSIYLRMSFKHWIEHHKFGLILVPMILTVATSGLIFEQKYLIPAIQSQKWFKLLTVSNLLLYILCFISFYQSIVISNNTPENLLIPRLKNLLTYNHPFYTDKNICPKQKGKWKPPRTSHCSSCKCVVRMDHHCPYINNCLGLNNFKAFLLFCGYGGIFALQFLLLSINRYWQMMENRVEHMSSGIIILWIILIFCSVFLSLSMLGITISNIFLAMKNLTSMDLLKGNFKINDKNKDFPNPYDFGVLTNLNNIFEDDKWLFWWPSEIVTYNDGTKFPMIPPVHKENMKQLPSNIRNLLKTPEQKNLPATIDQLRSKEGQNYKNIIFFYLGEQYRLKLNQDGLNQNQVEELNEQIIQNEVNISLEKDDEQSRKILEQIYDE